MSDRIDRIEGTRRRPEAVLGSAAILDTKLANRPDLERWQAEAWKFFDESGELRSGISWLSQAMTRCRLVAGRYVDGSDEPARMTTGVAADVLANFGGGPDGQAELLASATSHLSVPGVGYFVSDAGMTNWRARSADELDLQGDEWIEIVGDTGRDDRRPVTGMVVKAWRRHPRYSWKPDSPVRAAIPILRELALLTQHVEASALSRLAGAGLLILPDNVDFPQPKSAPDGRKITLMEMLSEAMATAIKERGSAAALTPITIQMPAEAVEHVQHLTFSTPFDERTIELRDEARRRLAIALDMPPEILLGLGDTNHWSAWQIEEAALTLHVEPMLQSICAALTVGFLRPTLAALVDARQAEPEEIGDVRDWVVWYDTSGLSARPDKGEAAAEALDHRAIGLPAYRRERGFAETDAPNPEEERNLLLTQLVVGAPSLAPALLPLLGIDLPPGVVPQVPTAPGVLGPEDRPELMPPATSGPAALPATRNVPPPRNDQAAGVPSRPQPIEIAASGAAVPDPFVDGTVPALLAAADAIMFRAFERVGSRIRSKANGRHQRFPCITASATHEIHACVDPTRFEEIDRLLQGAWDRVPEVARRLDVEPYGLTAALDHHARALLAAGEPYSYDGLVAALGAPG